MSLPQGVRIGFFGAGNMAEALARGLLSTGFPGASLMASDLKEDRRRHLREAVGIETTNDNRDVLSRSNICIFAVKPQDMPKLLAILSPASPEKLFISICAGVTTRYIEKILSGAPRVVRAMPNTPMLVGAGVAAVARGRWATDDDLKVTRTIFSSAAEVVDVEESLMDAVTAVSGSGPAYFFYLVELMTDAGIKLGLPADAAALLARRTCLGAGRLLAESDESARELRRKVSSPGGTTFAAISKLEEAGVDRALSVAIEAAAARSKELGL